MQPRNVDLVSQLALLRARALLRVGGADAAERARDAINAVFVTHGTLDASLTAQMLLGSAEVALGEIDAGVARLEAAQAASVDAHPTVRSEIALRRARGYYARRELDRAESALRLVSSRSDIVYAQALNYRGWIDTARGDYAAASLSFVAAITHLDLCRQHDRLLEANALQALSHLAAERFDDAAMTFVEGRAARLDWSADGLALPRFWITMSVALAHESAGDVLPAFRSAREAESLAPSAAYRVLALCRRAAIARGVGESATPADILHQALDLLDAASLESLEGDERTAPLVVAEELAAGGDPRSARWWFERYRKLEPMERVWAFSSDPRKVAYERMIDAAIGEAAGETARARRGFGDAFRRFDEIGYTRRAVACALRLAELTGHDRFYQYIAENAASTSPHYWVRRLVAQRERYFCDPVISHLTSGQREVLDLICQGYTNPEIAKMRDRSLNTIKHTVTSLLETFGARGRSQLRDAAERRLSVGRYERT